MLKAFAPLSYTQSAMHVHTDKGASSLLGEGQVGAGKRGLAATTTSCSSS